MKGRGSREKHSDELTSCRGEESRDKMKEPNMDQIEAILPRLQAWVSPPGNIEQAEIRLILIEQLQDHIAHPDADVEDMISTLREDLPPKKLFCAAALLRPNMIHRFLRIYLVAVGIPYRKNLHDGRIVYGLPSQFYSEDRQIAEALILLKAAWNECRFSQTESMQ